MTIPNGTCRIHTDVVLTSSLPYRAQDYSRDLRRARINAYCKGIPPCLRGPTPHKTLVKNALRRETDEQVLRRWSAGMTKKLNFGFYNYKFEKPTTLTAIRRELGLQAKRMASGAGEESITAAGVRRGSIEERDLYNDWMSGNH